MEGLSADTPVLSVIIPLYNAEAYLQECIDSVRSCPVDKIECILVNDGSTDGSRAICEAAISGDKRFRLLNKDNGGVSSSRNSGLDAARGEYIMFLDSDDYMDVEQWSRILSYTDEPDADFIAFGYYSLLPSGSEQKELFPISGETSANPSDTYMALLASPMLNTCWGKLLRRSVIREHGLRFDTSLITCEDAVFIIDYVKNVRSYLLCNTCILYYRIHETSAMRMRPLEDKLRDFGILYARRTAFLGEVTDPDLRKAAFRECFSVITNLLLEYAVRHGFGETQAAGKITLAHPVTGDILASMEPRGMRPFFKRFEYALMRRNLILPLVLYFKLKGRFKSARR